MAQQALLLKFIGIPTNPIVTEVNIRADAGTNFALLFKVPVGTSNIPVLDAKADLENRNFNGKTYQWLKVSLPQGQGWVRDDMVAIWGDGTKFGYPNLTNPSQASTLNRGMVVSQPTTSPQPSSPAPTTTSPAPAPTTSAAPFLLKAIGLINNPAVTEVNIRSDAGTNGALLFKVPVGTSNCPILEVKADVESRNLNGKVYQWFRATFPQGQGWVRDDLVEISGDGTKFGYPVLTTGINGFNLKRSASSPAPASTSPQPSSPAPATTTTSPVATAPATQPATPAAPAVTGAAMATCMGKSGVNVRSGAAMSYPQVTRINYKEMATVLDTKVEDNNPAFHWVKVSYQGKEGWVREDYVRLSGAFKAFNLNAPDKYPSPAPDSWWVRGYDPSSTLYKTGPHKGWDHGGNKGTPLYAGPQGGIVFDAVFCQRCGAEGVSTLERGFSVGDSRIFSDPSWNFGYGHYVIVGYEHSKLPESTKQYLAVNNKAGWNIFVMYAHLHQMLVKKGDTVTPNQQIALMGNSGNSEAAHLHLEIRAAQTMNIQSWAQITGGLMSPGVLFSF
jgi:uncharacterized protein YgiM (DUF1202 family)